MVRVVRVIDGDSVIVVEPGGLTSEVRLYGIDAPELSQPHGAESADALGRILGRESFWLEDLGSDKYERVVGLLFHRGSHRRNSVNLKMVREGHAYAYTRYGGGELGFHPAERDATESRVGMWSESCHGGERPWDYRARDRRQPGGTVEYDGSFGCLMAVLALVLVLMFALVVVLVVSGS